MDIKIQKGTDGKFGIENLEKMIRFTGDFEDYLAKVFKDNKVKFMEAVRTYFEGRDGITHIVKNADAIKNEFLDLSAEEKLYLSPIIADAYECKEDEVEEIIQQFIIPTWAIIANTSLLINNIKERKNKAA